MCTHCSSLACLRFSNTGRKKKEQHDANQAAGGLNPGYGGAYGAAPPVSSVQSSTTCSLYRVKFYQYWLLLKLMLPINFPLETEPLACAA